MKRPFHTLDVFTQVVLEGNPLAVVSDAEGLDGARMQAVAREFNLSETVFVLPPRDAINSARIRIFTPARELPFAGHPTVGAAVLLAQLRAPEILGRQDLSVVVEEEIGLVACTVRKRNGVVRASFVVPRQPAIVDEARPAAAIAAALGLAPEDITVDGHQPCVASAGVPFTFVPVAGLDAAFRAWPDPSAWDAGFAEGGVFIYTREVALAGSSIHARMFAPGLGIAEDPATGSAVAALAAVLARFETFEDGDHTLVIEQGLEMERPSFITLGLEIEGGRLASASIGGAAVLLSQGEIDC